MANDTTNPCLSCSTGQHCCSRLGGLLLSGDEFARHFSQHLHGLVVRRSGQVVIVSAKQGGACPHWGKDGCGIYRERPIDCRVYPYTPTHIIDKGRVVKIVFHGRADCPQRESLFRGTTLGEVTELLTAFGKMLYGVDRAIVVQHEKGLFSRMANRIEAALQRRLNRIRPR